AVDEDGDANSDSPEAAPGSTEASEPTATNEEPALQELAIPATQQPTEIEIPESIYNAPPLLVEVSDKLPKYKKGDAPHIINLSLLPHTDEDISFMSHTLGIGPTIILSRSYGNCRISSTNTKNAWWVQFFNSQDTLILNTLELIDIPSVAKASKEDIEDSAERLQEILSIYDEERTHG
ncbi:MAG: hydrogenase expression/formation protein, partial [Proteobacteria bacterium]|nr:hydrogenase expression/formation protein [Pseudomonadota bacterium]